MKGGGTRRTEPHQTVTEFVTDMESRGRRACVLHFCGDPARICAQTAHLLPRGDARRRICSREGWFEQGERYSSSASPTSPGFKKDLKQFQTCNSTRNSIANLTFVAEKSAQLHQSRAGCRLRVEVADLGRTRRFTDFSPPHCEWIVRYGGPRKLARCHRRQHSAADGVTRRWPRESQRSQ
jgi:hypothetical protein